MIAMSVFFNDMSLFSWSSFDSYILDVYSSDMEEACSRGLDNLGRVYARKGDYSQAITV